MIMLSVHPWSAAISISLLAVVFHRNIDIAKLVSTNRLKNGHFPNRKFQWNKIAKFRKMEKWVTFLTMEPREDRCRWIEPLNPEPENPEPTPSRY